MAMPAPSIILGIVYLRGDGARLDQSRAPRWLILAARKRYAPSQAALDEFFWKRGTESLKGARMTVRTG